MREKEVLSINVEITGSDEVKGIHGEALMIHFTGDCDCELFHGKILKGGVDTQKQFQGEARTLSARYMLEGVDSEGKQCRLFVENNATIVENGETAHTIPKILTDSRALSFLETANLRGTILPAPKGVTIKISMMEK